MKKILFVFVFVFVAVGTLSAKRKDKPQEVDSLGNKIKTGWNFGILPSVAYDADRGFQGGLLGNVYFYGDGSQYPEYIHSLYFEGAYSTKHNGIARVHYDSKYLIPNHRVTLDALYVPDAMCDFFGFNGYQSIYHNDWAFWKKNADKMPNREAYQSRMYYKYRRDLVRVAGDFEGTIWKDIRWNAGLGVLGYIVDRCDVDMLNGKKEFDPETPRWDQKPLDPSVKGLYEKYCDWGLISEDEKRGGWHPYLRGGFSYDTRDKRQGPNSGIYADAFVTYSAAFNAAYGQQAAAGYNHLQLNLTFRHYVPCYRDKNGQNRITFAYRLGTQNLIAGRSPFYMQNYLNTQFIQRMFYEGLGGGNSIRGMMANRILANGFAYANIEFRFRVVNFDIKRQHFFIGLNPFFDMGIVTQPIPLAELDYQGTGMTLEQRMKDPTINPECPDGYELGDYFSSLDGRSGGVYRPHMTAGIGLKVGMNENFVLSADWAMPVNEKYYLNQDNGKLANFYIKMGYLF